MVLLSSGIGIAARGSKKPVDQQFSLLKPVDNRVDGEPGRHHGTRHRKAAIRAVRGAQISPLGTKAITSGSTVVNPKEGRKKTANGMSRKVSALPAAACSRELSE